MKKQLAACLVGFYISGVASGCATVMKGKVGEFAVESEPTGADIILTAPNLPTQNVGQTPKRVRVEVGPQYTLTLRKPGYQDRQVNLQTSVGASYIIADIFLGLIPVLVDWITGNWNQIGPDPIRETLVALSPTSTAPTPPIPAPAPVVPSPAPVASPPAPQQPLHYSGSQMGTVGPFNLGEGIHMFEFTYEGDGVFKVELLSADGRFRSTIAESAGRRNIIRQLSLTAGDYTIVVTGNEPWKLDIK